MKSDRLWSRLQWDQTGKRHQHLPVSRDRDCITETLLDITKHLSAIQTGSSRENSRPHSFVLRHLQEELWLLKVQLSSNSVV